MSKKCIYCQKEIPDDANFCMYCAKSQTEKQEIVPPRPKRKKAIIACAVIAVLIIAAVVVWLATRTRTIDNGGAELLYRQNGRTWHMLLRSSVDDMYHWKTPEDTYFRKVESDIQAAIPLQFYVYDEESGQSVAEEFMTLVERSEVVATPQEGSSAPQCNLPAFDQGFSSAALVTDIVYDASCADNDLA